MSARERERHRKMWQRSHPRYVLDVHVRCVDADGAVSYRDLVSRRPTFSATVTLPADNLAP